MWFKIFVICVVNLIEQQCQQKQKDLQRKWFRASSIAITCGRVVLKSQVNVLGDSEAKTACIWEGFPQLALLYFKTSIENFVSFKSTNLQISRERTNEQLPVTGGGQARLSWISVLHRCNEAGLTMQQSRWRFANNSTSHGQLSPHFFEETWRICLLVTQ